jgi:hypothetical protein
VEIYSRFVYIYVLHASGSYQTCIVSELVLHVYIVSGWVEWNLVLLLLFLGRWLLLRFFLLCFLGHQSLDLIDRSLDLHAESG